MTSAEKSRAVIDDIKAGALSVINKTLHDTLQKSGDFEQWSQEDRAKYFLILDVRDEILRRVRGTLGTD